MIVNRQSRGAVSGSPEEGLQLMQSKAGEPTCGEEPAIWPPGWDPKAEGKGVGLCHSPKQNGPEWAPWDVYNQGKLATVWGSFSEIHCPFPMIGVLS